MSDRLPTCPRCASNDRTEILEPAASGGWPAYCAPCGLLFRGTHEEWDRMRPVREKYRSDQARAEGAS